MLGCLAAGCTGGSAVAVSNPPSSAPPKSAASTNPDRPPAPAATFALTGLGTASKTAASARVIAAAITAGYGRPQPTGANLADTVYVEYSDTLRLIALYQAAQAPDVGPIAQTRPADGQILAVLNPGYANAGGPVGFVKVLDQSTVSDLSSVRDAAAYQIWRRRTVHLCREIA